MDSFESYKVVSESCNVLVTKLIIQIVKLNPGHILTMFSLKRFDKIRNNKITEN